MSASPRLSMARRVASSGDRLEDEPLYVWNLPPVLLVRFQHQLHARGEGYEPVGPGADGELLEALVADLLHVLPWDDPAGSGGQAPVEGQEIGPGLLEPEAHAARVRHLDRGDPVLHRLDAAPR